MRSSCADSGSDTSEDVVAGGPDTAGREAWLWDLRVDTGASQQKHGGSGSLQLAKSSGAEGLRLRFDERELAAEFTPMTIPAQRRTVLERSEKELVVIVFRRGRLKEGTRVLDPGDVLIVEGDDPVEIALVPLDGEPADVSVGRLLRHDGRSLRWMP